MTQNEAIYKGIVDELVKEAGFVNILSNVWKGAKALFPTVKSIRAVEEGANVLGKSVKAVEEGSEAARDLSKAYKYNSFDNATDAMKASGSKLQNFANTGADIQKNIDGKLTAATGSSPHGSMVSNAFGTPARYVTAVQQGYQEGGVAGAAKNMVKRLGQDWTNEGYHFAEDASKKIYKGSDGNMYYRSMFGDKVAKGSFVDNVGNTQHIFENRLGTKILKRGMTPQGMAVSGVGMSAATGGNLGDATKDAAKDALLWGPFRPVGEAKAIYDIAKMPFS